MLTEARTNVTGEIDRLIMTGDGKRLRWNILRKLFGDPHDFNVPINALEEWLDKMHLNHMYSSGQFFDSFIGIKISYPTRSFRRIHPDNPDIKNRSIILGADTKWSIGLSYNLSLPGDQSWPTSTLFVPHQLKPLRINGRADDYELEQATKLLQAAQPFKQAS